MSDKNSQQSSAPLPVAASFDDILTTNDRPEITIEVSEWGCSIVVRELDVESSIAIAKSTTSDKGAVDVAQNWIKSFVAGVVRPVVSQMQAEKMLGRNANVFQRILAVIQGKKKDGR